MENKCKNCKHFMAHNKGGYGTCKRINEEIGGKAYIDYITGALDDEPAEAYLVVAEDFGCRLFEPLSEES